MKAESGDVAVVEATPSELRKLRRVAAIERKLEVNLCLCRGLLLVWNDREAIATNGQPSRVGQSQEASAS